MSKTYSVQIEKTQSLLKGLRNNASRVKEKGLDDKFICKLETDNDLLKTYNEEYDRLKVEFRAKTIEANLKLNEVKNQAKEAKKIIKRCYEQPEWVDFGVNDKK
jgi:hypothetical protein